MKIPDELRRKYYVEKVRLKKKGANKGYKKFVTIEWNPNFTRNDFIAEFRRLDPKGCGLFLCELERMELSDDRWWDTPEYRVSHLRSYRATITRIRKEYGLTSKDVAEYMKVN